MAKNYWEENWVSGTELMAMRMMRKKSLQDMAKMARSKKYRNLLIMSMSARDLNLYEKNLNECPPDVVEFYMRSLGITRSHMAQFKKILKGKLKAFTEGRQIAKSVKDEVRNKCKNRCSECGEKEKLQFHHIEYFSKGGQNTSDNLILLCASCHAEVHKGEQSYHMLKKMAEG
ncbi:HNH endonuclease [Cytobacillus sp. FSL R5-0596]|uniref:HNH endonuclease n=1 Tax=Cytobacillus sp. FSL R5-0596 TaxID=2954696 RepID=UPI0030F4B85A